MRDTAAAIRHRATAAIKQHRYATARALLRQSLQRAPEHAVTRNNYAVLLLRQQRYEAAMTEVEILLANDPANPKYGVLKATILMRLGRYAAAIRLLENMLMQHPDRSAIQLAYGHALKAVGRIGDAVAAYRAAIEAGTNPGEAYWSLANLKTYPLDDVDIAAMRTLIATDSGHRKQQLYLAFAMAKALEDRRQYRAAFTHYRRGNAMRRAQSHYNATQNSAKTAALVSPFTADFFARREGWGCLSKAPIFIVGLPRSGSTLLEQILASHSAVEGTGERPDVMAIGQSLARYTSGTQSNHYAKALVALSHRQCETLGQGYLDTTRIQRAGSPFFVDKMPNNFLHIGLLHLLLPNAKVIDIRRHPMAACLACYKQLFASGQEFSYDLKDIAHYYRDYVNVMERWDKLLPDKVLRVAYEDLVAQPDRQIRRLLKHCNLPFEQQCLEFYQTERAVRTPSAEQVRRPIFTHASQQWRHFERQLAPAKDILGPLLPH